MKGTYIKSTFLKEMKMKRLDFVRSKKPNKSPKKNQKGAQGSTVPSIDCDVNVIGNMLDVYKISLDDEKWILDFLHSAHVDGEKSNEVASLLFADFPTNFKVENFSENEVPPWNQFS
ncbi:hypothetical protein GOP47_0017591 [Adiantum capillus-veneris]|uniref:Uncharacterized protein n=1 Tax=Adiantum capillus-veneris TaxID=13818 RepID=A0A9D4UFM1_ADICA|nr:hypothetical protein GOP47_0017591 [Adiantum capillus-veneris]